MNLYHFDSLDDISGENGKKDGYKAVKVKTSFGKEIARVIIEPWGKVSPHKADVDVIFYVVKGSIEVTIDEQRIILHENDCLEVPKDTTRSSVNNHDIKAEFLIFRLTNL